MDKKESGDMNDVFDSRKIQVSDYPAGVVPSGAVPIIGVDFSKDGFCTVKGFYDPKTGKHHIQEIFHND